MVILPRQASDIQILAFEEREVVPGQTSVWATIKNIGPKDILVRHFSFMLVYTVNPGGSFMKGGNSIMSYHMRNATREGSPIPQNQTIDRCLYAPGDLIQLVWQEPRRENGNLRRDYDWLCAQIEKSGSMLAGLSFVPATTWLELRTPDWRLNAPNSKQVLNISEKHLGS